jgi:O-antigen ligase
VPCVKAFNRRYIAKQGLTKNPFLSLALLFLALLALLAAGSLWAQHAFLTRGIQPVLPPPIDHGRARLGINVTLEQADAAELESTLSQIKALGITTIKQPFYFTDDFDWQASDALIEAAVAQELALVPLLDGDPADQFTPPADPNDFAAWTGEFAKRYGESVDAYIIWDEPNISTHWGQKMVNSHEYAALLAAASAAIRSADPDAIIVAAPLAPTTETGPQNLADDLFLQELYDAGAAHTFDVAAAKPYGFDTGPEDRTVDRDTLNFSRAVLLREVMERNGDGHKALWAGNWGWNSLPADWQGSPSIWGQINETRQADWTVDAIERARQEWPWMGMMFLENWEVGDSPDDPRWGFSIAGRETAATLQQYLQSIDPSIAYPGFRLAQADDPAQFYEGGWRFSPDYGADISQPGEGEPADRVTFTFWGTDVGLRVRRANFRSRLYITIDGEPANGLPQDENGAVLVLTSADPTEDYIAIEPVAKNLAIGQHTLTIVASRGWDQWALNGFTVGYKPYQRWWIGALLGLSAVLFVLAVVVGRRADWATQGKRTRDAYNRLGNRGQLIITGAVAMLVSLTGWLTWGEQLAGMYRRLGDGGQLALTAAAASLFYVTPVFFVYALALFLLFLLILLRPAWGLVLIAFCIPFYVPQLVKPIATYRFSPVEIFTLLTLAAFLLRWFAGTIIRKRDKPQSDPTFFSRPRFHSADIAVMIFTGVATLSLLFTTRLDVATNEWRMVILVPALFYLAFRGICPKKKEMWVILDAFILGAVLVALIGLWQYATGRNLITAEGGLMRLRSIYGSPNNVALYLGRVLPLLVGMLLLGTTAGRRRWLYGVAIIPVGLALLLTFSKGGLLLGVPAGLLVVFWIWQRDNGRSPWPWVIAFTILGAAGLFLARQIPQLAQRLDLFGVTGVFRVNLWRASLEMIRENPLLGVGLDNFLYAYRGRYILDAAWQEPNLNHPHNIFLDFATRLGLLGLLAGGWMIWVLARTLKRVLGKVSGQWLPVAAGGIVVWLDNLPIAPKITRQS